MRDVQESVAMLLIGAVLFVYLKQRGLVQTLPHVEPAKNVDEPDTSRWRHDGSQTFTYQNGNRPAVFDDVAYDLSHQISA